MFSLRLHLVVLLIFTLTTRNRALVMIYHDLNRMEKNRDSFESNMKRPKWLHNGFSQLSAFNMFCTFEMNWIKHDFTSVTQWTLVFFSY